MLGLLCFNCTLLIHAQLVACQIPQVFLGSLAGCPSLYSVMALSYPLCWTSQLPSLNYMKFLLHHFFSLIRSYWIATLPSSALLTIFGSSVNLLRVPSISLCRWYEAVQGGVCRAHHNPLSSAVQPIFHTSFSASVFLFILFVILPPLFDPRVLKYVLFLFLALRRSFLKTNQLS